MPRATACSSSTIRIVAAIGARSYTGGPRTPSWYPLASTSTSHALRSRGVAQRSRPLVTTARPSLKAQPRTITGKHVARLRRDGQLPAVVYGRGEPSTNVVVNLHEFEQLRRHAGPNTLVDLSIDGG